MPKTAPKPQLTAVTALSPWCWRTDGPVPAWFKDYLEAEGDALTLRIWQPLIVPGLLQIPEYAHALFVAAGADSDKAGEMVAARMSRQSIFERPKPPNVSVVLDESVLHRLIGSPQVMHDQLVHLVELSQRPHMMIQVLPADNRANAGLGGALNLASGDGTPDVLLTEAVEDQTDPATVAAVAADVATAVYRLPQLPGALGDWLNAEAAAG